MPIEDYPPSSYPEGKTYVAFLDISGFKEMMKREEQALNSILDYLETQNNEKSSNFLNERSFLKESSVVPRAGFEPATTRSSAGRSPRLSYLG